jgi:hypothetical protein
MSETGLLRSVDAASLRKRAWMRFPFLILIVVAIPAVISTRNFWIAIPVLFVCILAAFTNKVAAKFGRQ